MKIRFIKYYALIAILGFGCTKYSKNDILLQIGTYKLSVAEYELVKSKYKGLIDDYKLEGKLKEEGYIIAYALENRFDTIDVLSKKLKYAMRLYTSQVDGYVWNKRIKPKLVVSSDDIKNAYNKRSTEYALEAIYFPNRTCLTRFLATDSQIESEKEFYLLKKQIASASEVKFIQFRNNYPFYPLGVYTNKIHAALIGDVWGPFETLDGFYVVHVTDILKTNQPPYEVEKPKIEKELLDGLTDKYIWESQKDIFSKAAPVMHDVAISEMASRCIEGKREWPGIEKSKVLMDYKFQGKDYAYTVSDFIEFVNSEPVFYGSLSNADDMNEMLKSYLIDLYLFDEAQKMNIDIDKDYLLYKDNFQKKLFVEYYKNYILKSGGTFGVQEVQKYYDNNRNNLKGFESATITVYKFNDAASAYDGWWQIANLYKQKPVSNQLKSTKLKGLLSITEDMEIQLSDTSYNADLIRNILEIGEDQVSTPVEINGEFWVSYLSKKKGSTQLPYKYAKNEIEQILFDKKGQENYSFLLDKLKTKYILKVNHIKDYNLKMKK